MNHTTQEPKSLYLAVELEYRREYEAAHELRTMQARIADLEAQLHAIGATIQPPAAHQEPVAWRVHPFDYGVGYKGVYAMTMRPEQVKRWERKGWRVEPLYTAPQPARKPLTNEQIVAVANKSRAAAAGDAGYILPISFARAIEEAFNDVVGQQ